MQILLKPQNFKETKLGNKFNAYDGQILVGSGWEVEGQDTQ